MLIKEVTRNIILDRIKVRPWCVMASIFHPKQHVASSSPGINLSKIVESGGDKVAYQSFLIKPTKVGTLCIGYCLFFKMTKKNLGGVMGIEV